MTDTHPTQRRLSARVLAGLALAAGGALAVTGCGSSQAVSSTKTTPSPSATQPPGKGSATAYTIKTATVPSLGTVLVNGQGRTLYLLSSEKGGKLTCTDANGCTKVWPDAELPAGVTTGVAGGGVDSTLLSTVKTPDGKLYLAYGPSQWPLYTFSGDSAPGEAHGQNIHSFGGTWSAITSAGNAATGSSGGTSSSTSGGY